MRDLVKELEEQGVVAFGLKASVSLLIYSWLQR